MIKINLSRIYIIGLDIIKLQCILVRETTDKYCHRQIFPVPIHISAKWDRFLRSNRVYGTLLVRTNFLCALIRLRIRFRLKRIEIRANSYYFKRQKLWNVVRLRNLICESIVNSSCAKMSTNKVLCNF